MGSANADLVRAAYALEYGGEDWLRWVDEHLSPEFEIEDRTLPEELAGLSGSTAARAHAARMRDAFEQVGYAIEELRDLGDRVLVRARGHGRGRGSGVSIEGTLGHLWALRNGRVARLDVYGTWQEALDAAERPG